jgi:hypothetical protein
MKIVPAKPIIKPPTFAYNNISTGQMFRKRDVTGIYLKLYSGGAVNLETNTYHTNDYFLGTMYEIVHGYVVVEN